MNDEYDYPEIPESDSDSDSGTRARKDSRREFLGTAALTTAGVGAGLSAFYANRSRKKPLDLSEFESDDMLVRTGHIGVGNRGGSLLRTALQVPGSYPVAICDKQPAKRNDLKDQIEKRMAQRRPGKAVRPVKLYDDYRRLLDDKDVEAVFIATPHYLHGPMAIDAVEAGKHVYCEKALAFTIGENQDIVALSDENPGLVFQVGHQRHYSPLYRRVAHMVETDQIGDLVGIRAHWNLNDETRRPAPTLDLERIINWRLYSEYSGGLTTEYATHQIDIANWFYGVHPHSVCGVGGVDWYRDGRDTHDHIHLIYNYLVPVKLRDPLGRIVLDENEKPRFQLDEHGQVVTRQVTFDYQSSMANSFLSPPSELVMGRYGTIEMTLAGGEFFKEKKARQDINRIAEGTNPARAKQKDILKSGVTVATGAKKEGDPIEEEPLDGGKRHWSKFIEPIAGAYDKIETLLAVESFHKCVRRARAGQPFASELQANARVGMESAVAALMANIAMRENRTVYWSEFSNGKA